MIIKNGKKKQKIIKLKNFYNIKQNFNIRKRKLFFKRRK